MGTEQGNKRASIAFIPKAAADVEWLMAHKSLNQNDVTNRSVQVYAFLERILDSGKVLCVANEDGSNIERVHII